MNKYLLYHAPWQFLMLIIFIQSSISMIELPDMGIDWFDKIVHFVVYGVLGFLVVRGFSRIKNIKIMKYYVIWSIFITSAYGITDEIHQFFVAGRICSFGDWLADMLGSIFVIYIYSWYKNKKCRDGSQTAPIIEKHP
jgi:VanZ family protein